MPGPRSRFVDNDGVRLHVIDSDPDDHSAAPVVFVPGMSDVAEDYVPVLDAFGRRTVVVDLRGHGPSDAPDDGYTLADRARDIAAVVDATTDGPVHLVTFSRGTCYALRWAADHRDRVRSLAIGDYPAREIALPEESVASFVAGRWRGTPVASRIREKAARRIFHDAVDRPLWAELRALTVPLLVVRSTAEAPLTDDDWARYAAERPDAQLVEFTDSPHDIFRPERTRYPELVRDHVEAAEV